MIDTHCHLGVSKLTGLTVTEADLLETMQSNGIEICLVMPHSVTDDPVEEHNKVADLCQRHPRRFRGIVNLSPLWEEKEYRREATRCIRDLEFVAIKLNPPQHMTSPIMANANKVFESAVELGVPVIVHTGPGVPWALPSLTIPQARRHPQLPIVLAHAGFAVYTAEAYVAADVCPNIYLEPSWSTVHDLKMLVQKIGSDRILFGSDLPDNVPVEIAKYKAAGLSNDELEDCLYRTAAKVFKL